MTAPTPQVTDRGRQMWWWVAGAALVMVVMAIVWVVGRDDDTVAQVESAPTATTAPTVSVEPPSPSEESPEPAAEPEPTSEQDPQPTTPPDRAPEPEPQPPPQREPEPDTQALRGAGYGPFSGGTTPPVGGSWIVDVRSAGHAGYDRVVVEFDGPVVPTYQVGYTVTSGPFHDVPGNVVPIEGEAFLDVWLQGTSRVDMTEDYTPVYTGPTRLRSDTTRVTEVVEIEDFEANVHWLIGLDGRAEFVVWTLDSPSRLVVDIAH